VCIVFVCLFFTASATISYYMFCVSQDILEYCRNPVFNRFFQCGVFLFCFALFFFFFFNLQIYRICIARIMAPKIKD